MRRLVPLLCLGGLTCSAASQLSPEHLVVATRLAGSPATQLLQVDPATGGVQTIGRFASDSLPPLVVEIDPINRDLLVALDAGGRTRIVRLELRGLSVASERLVTETDMLASDIEVGMGGDVFLTYGTAAGGLYRLSRYGGAPTLVALLPRTDAIVGYRQPGRVIRVFQSGDAGPPVVDPQVVEFDIGTGNLRFFRLNGHRPLSVADVHEDPTTIGRHLLFHDDGTAALSSALQTPVPLQVTPALPPGGTVAAAGEFFEAYIVGNASHPFVKTVDWFALSPTWTIVAGPLPGDPVDMDFSTAEYAFTVPFGAGCGQMPPLRLSALGTPRLGNDQFEIRLNNGVPGRAAIFVLGVDDFEILGRPLPFRTPSGCDLLVSTEILLGHVVDAAGGAAQRVPIPTDPRLIGGIVFVQWLHESFVPFQTTDAMALQLGR